MRNNAMSLVNDPVDRKDQARKKYCRFKKAGIKYVDYKDARKNPSSSSDRKQLKIPTQSIGCYQTCETLSFDAIRS